MDRRMIVRKQVPLSIWIGWDPREQTAFEVARRTARQHAASIPVLGIVLERMRRAGLYWRKMEKRGNQLWDVISDAPCATEFSLSRFLTPHLAREGWALFMDCDMMVRGDLYALFLEVERNHDDKAIVCVKHRHEPTETVKMDGVAQTRYPRKNWSSFMFVNVDHPANRALTIDLINEAPGRDLHAFSWLGDDADDLIGELPPEWNWLNGYSDPSVSPLNVHFTGGVPAMEGHENDLYADVWWDELYDHVDGGLLKHRLR